MAQSRYFPIYERLPVFLQNVCCSLEGIRIRRRRFHRTFHQALAFLEQSQWWSAADQLEHQNELLRGVIDHAYQTVPYYREIFQQQRLTPRDVRTIDDLPKLPILTKQTVRRRFADMQSANQLSRRRLEYHTGGTTGTALELAGDIDTDQWQWAVWWRHRRRFGVGLHDPFVSIAGRSVVPLRKMGPPFWRRNLALHQTYVSIHHLLRQNMPALAGYLQARRVAYYSGYPSGLYTVATYFLEHGVKLPHPPRAVFTGAETVLPHHRRIIEQAFDTELADQYGALEHACNISECERHTYHVDSEFGIIEFLPVKGQPDGPRRIIATSLRNPVMPLIRYDTGDLATLADGPCDCGRPSTTVRGIDGRIESVIVTPDGRQISRLDFLFKESEHIEEAQLIQDAVDHVLVKVVRSQAYDTRDEQRLMHDLREFLGEAIRIEITHVDEIPRGPNGKFRQIVSEIYQDRYAPAAQAVHP